MKEDAIEALSGLRAELEVATLSRARRPGLFGAVARDDRAPGRRAGSARARHELELDVFVLVLGGMALLGVVSWLRQAVPPRAGVEARGRARAAARRQRPRIPELDRLERELYDERRPDFDLHYRLRPVVREIAVGRLERRGLRLDSGSPAVRELLGDGSGSSSARTARRRTTGRRRGPGSPSSTKQSSVWSVSRCR